MLTYRQWCENTSHSPERFKVYNITKKNNEYGSKKVFILNILGNKMKIRDLETNKIWSDIDINNYNFEQTN
jgi:hypothetical protein